MSQPVGRKSRLKLVFIYPFLKLCLLQNDLSQCATIHLALRVANLIVCEILFKASMTYFSKNIGREHFKTQLKYVVRQNLLTRV